MTSALLHTAHCYSLAIQYSLLTNRGAPYDVFSYAFTDLFPYLCTYLCACLFTYQGAPHDVFYQHGRDRHCRRSGIYTHMHMIIYKDTWHVLPHNLPPTTHNVVGAHPRRPKYTSIYAHFLPTDLPRAARRDFLGVGDSVRPTHLGQTWDAESTFNFVPPPYSLRRY